MPYDVGKFVLCLFVLFSLVEAKKCPTACTKDVVGCRAKGGKIIGYCVNTLPCCDQTYKSIGKCGETKSGVSINFVSPNFPKFHGNDLVCSFSLILLEDTVAVKIEFLNITMDGLGFAGNGAGCDSDMFIFKGFKTWTPPPLCGNLTGYTTVIERQSQESKLDQLKILALMSSSRYLWKMKLTQIRQPSSLKKPPNFPFPIPKADNFAQQIAPSKTQQPGAHALNPDGPEKSLFKIDYYQRAQDIILTPRPGKNIPKEINPDAENIFSENGEIFEDDDIDYLDTPMIVRGEETNIEEVPWQVSIRMLSTDNNSTDEDDEDEFNATTTTESTNSFGITIDYDNVLESNDTDNATATPPEAVARNCSTDEGYHFCGGSIISDRYILSAAHCFYGNSKTNGMESLHKIKIVLGDTDTCTRDFFNETDTDKARNSTHLSQQDYEIETVILHYGYDNIALLNDVAVIKLKHPIAFAKNVRRVRLAKPGEDFQGKEALGSGWGKMNLTAKGAELPHHLQSSRHFLIRNQTECSLESERLFGSNQSVVAGHPKYSHAFSSVICTSTKEEVKKELKGNVLVGPGDSGGPLVAEADDGDHVLIGIVSYGIPSEHADEKGEYVDFFQSTAYFHNWIQLALLV